MPRSYAIRRLGNEIGSVSAPTCIVLVLRAQLRPYSLECNSAAACGSLLFLTLSVLSVCHATLSPPGLLFGTMILGYFAHEECSCKVTKNKIDALSLYAHWSAVVLSGSSDGEEVCIWTADEPRPEKEGPIKAKKLIEIDETTISIRFLNKKLLDF